MKNNYFKVGSMVCFSEEWKDGDDQSYRIIEWNGDRGFIQPVHWDGEIIPTELVYKEMIVLI